MHKDAAFVTLTYHDDFLVHSLNGRLTLEPTHLRDFLKRLRERWTAGRLRFFAVGEYGEETERPHYHLAIFGLPSCTRLGRSKCGQCCYVCDTVSSAWGKGHVSVGVLAQESAAYIAGYVVKKLSKGDYRLDGRYPEFTRMSLRPGLGAGFVPEIASTLMENGLEKTLVDVPATLRHGRKEWPLGRYLRQKLRQQIGRDAKAPEVEDAEVLLLREDAFARSESFQAALRRSLEGYNASINAREGVFKKWRNKL